MRFGQLRGVLLATALISAIGTVSTVLADGFIKTIPREVLAQDLNTGQPYFAPPVPWGHYAKDGLFDHYYPKAGHFGFLHHGCKSCGGSGHGLGGLGCKGCGGSGCGLGSKCGLGGKCGLLHHGGGAGGGCGLGGGCGMGGNACGDSGCGLGHGSTRRIKDCGLCKNKGCGLCQSSSIGDPMYVMASNQTMPIQPVASSQSIDPNGGTLLCDSCTGKGCGKCGGCGLLHRKSADSCGSCGGAGCGKCGLFNKGTGCGSCGGGGCGKCGLFNKGSACGACGGKGCGLCGLFNKGTGCGACGGRGCGLCSNLKGKLAGLLHHKGNKIKYFVGPGGPVPLTPGYVPYTVTTRSPRDFLAFPPYTPSGF